MLGPVVSCHVKAGAAHSTNSDARVATLEAAVAARSAGNLGSVSLAVVFASPHHSETAGQIVAAVHEAVAPERLIGCVGQAIVSGRNELESTPAVAVWLVELARPVDTFAVDAAHGPEGAVFVGWTDPGDDATVLIADPYTFPADVLLRQVNEQGQGRIVGGLASGAAHAGETRLFLDDTVLTRGAVAARIPGMRIVTAVSQGCRPVGSPMLVTKAEGNLLFELTGRPALEVLQDLHQSLPPHEQALLSQGLMFGRVIDEYKPEWARGDFLIRGVMGADPRTGAIAVADRVEVGQTVQFHVRDAASADEDLKEVLERVDAELMGQPNAAALLFTCNGRGSHMFGAPDHDASIVARHVGDAVAGFFCAGELGPVGNQNFLHGFTASLAVLVDDDGSD